MIYRLMTFLMCCGAILIAQSACSQDQTCPANISFSANDFSFWSARTGLVNGSIPQNYPAPNNGLSVIPEYNISSTGIRVITSPGTDLYGNFPTIPTINGYSYNHSVQLGSTATSYDLRSTVQNPGGFTRSITYIINVPPGPVTTPYTMTYAYAMVLENGTHNSNEQPLFKATLSVHDSVITCASPQYYLPTFNNAQPGQGGGSGTGATLDTATALANGFTNSPVAFLSHAGTQGNTGTLLFDVWTKGWTEVTFDLSPYRGQQVSLTFESDNCTPGAHFAYAYVALRNNCAGLEISGNLVACTNTNAIYSVPALAGAVYNWTVPPGWTINSGTNSNIINVTVGAAGGMITANEINSCADLKDTIMVTTRPPTVAGSVLSNNTVCAGANATLLNLNGEVGNVLNWISSTDGTNWTPIAITTDNYNAQDLLTTTIFKAVVQNGSSCSIDTSLAATITVDPKSIGGILSPSSTDICAGQTSNTLFTLTGNTGAVQNWQISHDNTNWSNFAPVKTDSTYVITSVTQNTQFRTIVKSGVCPADTSTVAAINFINVPFPSASINPDSIGICYGKSATLNATINIGTSYTWTPSTNLTNQGNGAVPGLPYTINAMAAPLTTTKYVISVMNAGCPNPLRDTFIVDVSPRIIVFAGNDTSVVLNQVLQLNATANFPAANVFTWTPATALSATNIYNPTAVFHTDIGDYFTYVVRATDPKGCYGEDDIKVTLFKTGPDIFIPSAFTPNGDGKNDIIVPICVGIKQLNFFRIYNRWGQMVFSTSQVGQGWDGKIGGQPQATFTFVYMAQAVDYTGKIIFKKGTITLIR